MSDASPEDAVVVERIFDAPIEVIWLMWTEPEHFAAWYGPHGARIPVARMDLRVGGTRLLGMDVQTPDGAMQMWFTGEFREIARPHRLVYTESVADEDGRVQAPPGGHPAVTEVVVELSAAGERTKLVLTHRGIPADSPGAAGWNMAFDKLATLLTRGAT